MMKWVWLAAGGVVGTFARHFLSAGVYHLFGEKFPWGTFVVNVAGCFTIGLIAALGEGRVPLTFSERLFLVTGFCGAFTTFSTFMLETWMLVDRGNPLLALGNVLASVAVCFAAFRAGVLAADVVRF
jgi:CrcB protein